MRRAPKLITKPAVLPVELDDVKAYLGIAGPDQDARLTLLMESATASLDGYSGRLGRTLIDQTWMQDFDPCTRHRLAFPNVHSAIGEWRPSGGDPVSAEIVLDEDVIGPFVSSASTYGFGGGLLRVTYVCGYGEEPDDVPAPIREAIMISVAHRWRASSEDGQIRSETVEGVGVTAYNSPEQSGIGVEKQMAELLRPYRRGNAI